MPAVSVPRGAGRQRQNETNLSYTETLSYIEPRWLKVKQALQCVRTLVANSGDLSSTPSPTWWEEWITSTSWTLIPLILAGVLTYIHKVNKC